MEQLVAGDKSDQPDPTNKLELLTRRLKTDAIAKLIVVYRAWLGELKAIADVGKPLVFPIDDIDDVARNEDRDKGEMEMEDEAKDDTTMGCAAAAADADHLDHGEVVVRGGHRHTFFAHALIAVAFPAWLPVRHPRVPLKQTLNLNHRLRVMSSCSAQTER